MRFFPSLPVFCYRVLLCGALWLSSRCGQLILWNDSEKPSLVYLLPLAMLLLGRGKEDAVKPFWGWIPLAVLVCVNLLSVVAIWRFSPCYELGVCGAIALSGGTAFFSAWGILSARQHEGGRVALCCLFLAALLPYASSFAAMSSDDWASVN